ncbi:MAG: hypothetical protein ACI4JB_06130, partial [Porcipelethomonas sp.]
ADSLYMILFTMLCVMTVTLQIVLSTLLLGELLPDMKYKSLLSAVLMTALSAAANFLKIDLTPVTGVMILLLAVIFPIIMYIRRKNSNESKKTNISSASSAGAQRMLSEQ